MDAKQQLARWVDEYVDRLTHLAYTYLRDWAKAEDVVQEAFIKAYRAMETLEPLKSPLPWLIRIVINECRSSHRKTWREIVTTFLPEQRSTSAEDEYFRQKGIEDTHAAIMALPETYRTAVYLFYFEYLSTGEIATVLDISPVAARIRLTRGREKLRNHLERGDEGERRATNHGIGT